MSTLRVCVPAGYGMVYEFKSNGEVTGIFADMWRDFNSVMQRASNASLTYRSENDDIGQLVDEKTGAYDGCIGLIQNNQSDTMLQFTNYPLPAENVYQGQVITESVIQFIGTYASRQEGETVQLTSCFSTFDYLVWLLCILVAVASSMAIVMRRWLVSRRLILRSRADVNYLSKPSRSILYQVTTHMISKGSLQFDKGAFGKLITFSLSIFALLVIFHFCALIKTELVAVRPPKTLRSYKDLIDNKVGLAACEGMDIANTFAGGAPGSEERRLWDLTAVKYPHGGHLFAADPSTFPVLFERLMTGQIVLSLESLWTPLTLRYICRVCIDKERIALTNAMGWFPMKAKTIFPLIGEDEKARPQLKSILSNKLNRGGLMLNFRRAYTRIVETGIHAYNFKVMEHTDLAAKAMNLPDHPTSVGLIEECARNIIYKPDIHLGGIQLKNMKNMLAIYLSLLLVALFSLLVEIATGSVDPMDHHHHSRVFT